jgi:D-alanyl-D-alanine carboxypeptidase
MLDRTASTCRLGYRLRLLWFVGVLVPAISLALFGRAESIDDVMKAEIARQHIPGAAVAVLRAGEIIQVGAYGLADVAAKVPVATDTVFRLQSLSKPLTATGVMLLVEEGKIRLDDPVHLYLEDCPVSWREITVRHLLSQTSGLRDFINEATRDLSQEATDKQWMESIANQPLKFAPGEAWDYSNTNYLLLALIIHRASGCWYGDFLAERIFKPLGMTRTSVLRQGDALPRRAKGYWLEKNRVRPATTLPMSLISYGGGGIQSTVLDLAKWDAALSTERLLKRATLEQMWAPVRLNNGTTHSYGLGWEIGDIAQRRSVFHAGKWNGFATQMDRLLDDQLTVIVLTNLFEAAPARITRAVASTIVPALAAPVYKPIADREPATTARFFDVLRRTREGELRPDDFTDPVWAYIAPRIEQMKKDFTSLGAIQKLTLVERTEKDGERSYRYQARFARTTMLFHFVLTKDDRISVMRPEQVNQ